MAGARRISPKIYSGLQKTAQPGNRAKALVNSIKGANCVKAQATSYNWAVMDGNALFHDDYAYCEFNLEVVEYETGILYATNAADVYALRPYGTTYPYYNDLLENGMINKNAGAMIVDASDYDYVSIPMFQSGTTITWDDNTTEDILMASLNWVMEFLGYDHQSVVNSGLGGKNEAGHIYFPCTGSVVMTTSSLLSAAESAGDILQGFYSLDQDGLYGFYLPGAKPAEGDLGANEIRLSTPQYCFDDNKITLHMKAGSNIKVFKLGTYQAYTDDIADDVIANGTLGEYLQEGDLTIDCSGSAKGNSKIYIAVVGGDAQGNIKGADFIECYLVPDDDELWGEVKYALLTDGIIAPTYQLPVTTHTVKYQEALSNPAYIRLVNPYTCAEWPYAARFGQTSGHNHSHYIYIDATDPSAVVLETSPIGLTVDPEEGEAKVSSLAAYYMDIEGQTLAQVKAAGHTGTLSDDVVTFPKSSLLYANVNYKDGQYFNVNKNGDFKLQLNTVPGGIADIVSGDRTGDAVYYNLQGQRIDAPSAPGVYVERRPGQPARKITVR